MGILDTIKKKAAPKKKETAKTEPKAAAAVKPVKKEAAPAVKKAEVSSEAKVAVGSHGILKRPMVTEKSTELAQHGKYVFSVSTDANKIEIAKAVKALYDVKVVNVRIINQRGKIVFFGGRMGKRNNVKKAIVTVAKGQKINLFEGV